MVNGFRHAGYDHVVSVLAQMASAGTVRPPYHHPREHKRSPGASPLFYGVNIPSSRRSSSAIIVALSYAVMTL